MTLLLLALLAWLLVAVLAGVAFVVLRLRPPLRELPQDTRESDAHTHRLGRGGR